MMVFIYGFIIGQVIIGFIWVSGIFRYLYYEFFYVDIFGVVDNIFIYFFIVVNGVNSYDYVCCDDMVGNECLGVKVCIVVQNLVVGEVDQ